VIKPDFNREIIWMEAKRKAGILSHFKNYMLVPLGARSKNQLTIYDENQKVIVIA